MLSLTPEDIEAIAQSVANKMTDQVADRVFSRMIQGAELQVGRTAITWGKKALIGLLLLLAFQGGIYLYGGSAGHIVYPR